MSKEDALTLIELAQKYPEQKPALIQIAAEIIGGQASADGQDSPAPVVGLLTFPLEVFHNYKGRRVSGRLSKDGRVEVNGKLLKASPAAISVTGNSVNGWRWWQYRDPFTGQIREIDYLRDRGIVG